MIRSAQQTGYILLPVIVVITLVAAIALMMNTESALESNTAATELDAQQAQYVAEAGMNHALWMARQQGCGPYSDLTDEPLGSDKYTTKLTTDLGSTTGYSILVDQDSWIRDDNPSQNNASDTVLHIRNQGGGIERPLLRYDLSSVPVKAVILSATAWFYVDKEHPEGPIDIHRITADWAETDATWDSMSDNLDRTVLATIPTQLADDVWVSVNLTGQVQAWVNGEPNYGITMNTTSDGVEAEYASRESANEPYLEILVGVPPTSPAILKSEGTLANGNTRALINDDVTLVQQPGFVQLRPDAVDGKDAEIWDQAPNNNYGAAAETWVSSATSDTTRSLLQFNMGAVPVGASILGANLSLERQSGSGADQPVSAHRIKNPWSEDSVTWDQRESGTNWDTAGADFDNPAVATTPVGPGNQRYAWNITPLVQGWVDGSYPNYGVALVAAIPGMPGERFYTSDEGDPTRHPRLTISYGCECGTVCVPPQGSGKLLMVVINPTTLVSEDQKAKDLFESWGYTVSLLSESANQSSYDAAVAVNDVVFISETVNSGSVGTKLQNAPIGVVSQDGDYNPDLGLATGSTPKVGTDIDITSTDHYITRVFPIGPLSIYAAGMEQLTTFGILIGDQQTLAEIGGDASLVVLEKGAAKEGGGNAAGRRVILPLGTRYRFDWDRLSANGRLLVQRALAWGVGSDKKSSANLLLVVVNPAVLNVQLSAKKALIESWGYTVNLIDESDSQANFDAAIAVNDVAYIPQEINSSNLGTKLRDAAIGVVNEEGEMVDELGFSADKLFKSRHEIDVVDNTHYITQPFVTGLLSFTSSDQSVHMLSGSVAPGLQTLGESFNTGSLWQPSLGTLDVGDGLSGGGTASGRRVQLPWGGGTFDINELTDDGRTIMQRAIEWGAGAEISGGFYLDEFPDFSCDGADEYRGSNGTLDWSDVAWAEVGDDGRACGAGLRVQDDPLIADPGGNRLRLQNSDRGVERLVDLVGFTAAYFSFDYRRDGLSGGAAILVEVSGDGGSNWDTLDTIAAGNDAAYLSTSYDISAYIAADTMIRISSNSSFSGEAYIDNVRVDQSVVAAGPIAHWKLDDAAGPTAIDSVGGNDATLNGNPAWTTGVEDGALEFDGSGDYATTDNNFTPPPVGTVSFWMKVPGSPASHGRILGLHDTWEVRHVTTGTPDGIPYGLVFDLGVTGVNTEFVTTVTVDTPDQWYFVAATYDTDSDAYAVYLDGVLHKSGTYPSSLSVPAATPLSLGTRTGSSNYFDGTLDDVRIYDYALSASEIADLYATYSPSVSATYTELFQQWEASDEDTWETFDLSGFGVPADAVVEVAITNMKGDRERWGGVRAVGSSLDRRFLLHEAEDGGVDTMTLHVQADASSQIEHYSDKRNELKFTLLGYWAGASYVEVFEPFSANASNSWVAEDVGDDGLGPNQVAEIALINTSGSTERLAGLRATGSSLQRRFDIHEADAGGIDAVTLMVQTDATSSVEVYAESSGDIDFYVVGYWSTPPGTYTETGGVSGQVSAASTWETTDLTGFGVSADSVAQFVIANDSDTTENNMGVRQIVSALDRLLDLQEANDGGSNLGTMHVNVDGSSQVEWYAESGATDRFFYPVGWWVLSP